MLNKNKTLFLIAGSAKKLLVLSILLALSSLTLVLAETHEHEIQAIQEQHDDHDEHHEQAKKDDHDKHDDHIESVHMDTDHDKHSGEDQDEHTDEHTDEHGHGEEDHEEAGFVKISPEQQSMAEITVETIKYQKDIKQIISAPGEVVNDLYNTTLLTTQVDSKVLKRKVVLGQHVNKGDVIAVLFSLDIATAQNQLKVALSEWQRVKKLGKQTVSAKRFISAKAEYEKNKSLLQAYGFNNDLIQQLILGKNDYKSGEYPVLAPHDGVILEDNFQSGQFLSAGSTIALLVDEENVWIEALLAPEIGQRIPVGTKARVVIGNKTFSAVVIHDSHKIDETTRTRKIRLIIKNKDHLLHAGLFAKVFFELPLSVSGESGKVILLPETALMRSLDGDWMVFIEQEPGVFKQEEVELENTINGMHRIKGLKSGQRVAVQGAFFLASELAKGGFDPHNH
jgi:RND family efflux transporter MFP subunit